MPRLAHSPLIVAQIFGEGYSHSFNGESAETIGAVAQLGERLYGIQEVVGSIPIGSTLNAPFLLKEAGRALKKGRD